MGKLRPPRRPDYRLKVRRREGKSTTTHAGAAWVGETGAITIQPNPGIVLDWRDEVFITLFPEENNNGQEDESGG